ncbi:MAG: hexosaminidase, partial [Oceanospirillaceae bacterium]
MGLRLYFLVTILLFGCTQPKEIHLVSKDDIAIIPQPQSIEFSENRFIIDDKTIIHAPVGLENEVAILKTGVTDLLGFEMGVRHEPSETVLGYAITFQIDSTLSTNTDEWYMLGIQKHFILISARSTKGVMHGIQTLL